MMRILGEEINFRENVAFSLRRYRVWWAILLVTMAFDFITTNLFVSIYGIAKEGNLITRMLMATLGVYTGNFIGKVLQIIPVICFVGIHRRLGNLFLLFVILLNCWAVVINSLLL